MRALVADTHTSVDDRVDSSGECGGVAVDNCFNAAALFRCCSIAM